MKKRFFGLLLGIAVLLNIALLGTLVISAETGGDATAICEEEGHIHDETCPMSIQSQTLKVGDKIWIKKGAVIFENMEDEKGHTLLFKYQVEIVDIFVSEDEVALWYEFKFSNIGIGEVILHNYKYVKAEDTVSEEIEESGEVNSSTITLSDGTDMNASWDSSVFGGINVQMITQSVAVTDKTKTKVQEAISSFLDDDVTVLKQIPVDITFVDEANNVMQPVANKSVSLNFKIDNEQIPEDATEIIIVHICADGSVEIVGKKDINTDAEEQTIVVDATSFSTYVVGLIDSKYQPTLLSSALEGNNRYSVRSLKANLFDYDPTKFNEGKTIEDSFVFLGITGWSSVANGGVNDSEPAYANQGILKDTLDASGMPVMAFGGNTTGNDLFSPDTEVAGKSVYPNIDFEFVYDEETRNYIYSSAHNHAQLSSDNKKVQLYTDTLAVINNANPVISLIASAVKSPNDCTLTYANNQITGKINNSNGERTDPYFSLDFEDFAPSSKEKVVVRVKFNFNADGKLFLLYFNRNNNNKIESANDSRTLQGTYANGKNNNGWYEYEVVLDASENTYWKDYDVATFRIDPIDSQNGYEMGDNHQFVIESISVIRGQNAALNSTLNGGFYPFSKLEDSYAGQNDKFDITSWSNKLQGTQGVDFQQGSRAIYNGTSNNNNIEHLYLGLSMELPFYLPESKKIDGEEIIYTFNGDDDLWVFIDGKLVLDIGGGHGMIKGTINFTTGEVVVSNAVEVTGLNSGNLEAVSEKKKTINFEPGEHTMQLFYMERAGSISNCFMKFNFPVVPTSSLIISKEIEKTFANDLYLPDADEVYTFQLTAKALTHQDQTVNVNNFTYTLWGAGADSEVYYKPSNGMITLKRGQTARFESIDEQTEITVTEQNPNKYSVSSEYDYTTVAINDENASRGSVGTVTTTAENSQKIVFTNYYKDRFFDLIIEKTGCMEDIDPNQTFVFHVKCEATGVDMEVVICGNDKVTIKQLRFGEYTVTEDEKWSWRYEAKDAEQEINATEDEHKVTFVNERTEDKWLDGNSYCQNLLLAGVGKIANKQPDSAQTAN